jgi:hypothetical protein
MALIYSWSYLAYLVRGTGYIIAMLRGMVFMGRGSRGSSLVSWTITALLLQWAR